MTKEVEKLESPKELLKRLAVEYIKAHIRVEKDQEKLIALDSGESKLSKAA